MSLSRRQLFKGIGGGILAAIFPKWASVEAEVERDILTSGTASVCDWDGASSLTWSDRWTISGHYPDEFVWCANSAIVTLPTGAIQHELELECSMGAYGDAIPGSSFQFAFMDGAFDGIVKTTEIIQDARLGMVKRIIAFGEATFY